MGMRGAVKQEPCTRGHWPGHGAATGCLAVGLPLAGRRAGVSVWAGSAGGGHLGGRDLETSHQALGNARDGRSGRPQATPTSEIWGDLVEAKARSGRTSCPQVLRGLQAPAPNLRLPLVLTVRRLETPKGLWAELGRSCSTWSAGEGRQGGTTAAPHRATPSVLARCLARGSGEGLRGNLSPHP